MVLTALERRAERDRLGEIVFAGVVTANDTRESKMHEHARTQKALRCLYAAVLMCGNASGDPMVGTANDWPNHGGGLDESGYSRLAAIDTGNVGKLGLAWSLDLPGEVTLEATPIAVDGVLYFTGTYSTVYAVEAVTGKLLWKYDPNIWEHGAARLRLQFAASRGAAYAAGRVFTATFDGRLLALDARSGKLLWSANTVAPDTRYYITGAPRVFNDKIIIGNGGGDYGSRGYVTAYEAATGKQMWRFHVVPGAPEDNKGDPAMERAAATWTGEYWKTGTGGTVWNGITFDPELNRIYLGTGNAGPSDPAVRSPGGGDNLYLVSIVALDAATGRYIWHYQMNPREAWDYKATANMVATTLTIAGKRRQVLMQLPTNGFFYVIDRVNGKLISAEKTGKVTWAERIDLNTGRPVEAENIRYETGETKIWPSGIGAHNWQPMAFSAQTGLVYIPYMQAGVSYRRGTSQPGEVSSKGLSVGWALEDPEDGRASLLAWDPVRQQKAWKVLLDSFWNGGVLATAGNLVFQGTGSGFLYAYDATNGRRLWEFDAKHGVIGAPISYAVNGKQYVAILAGYGGAVWIGGPTMNQGWKYGAQPRRLLTFALDGNATLPPTAPRDMRVNAVDDPSVRIEPRDVESGRRLYAAYFCMACHGRELVSGGSAPDLRESGVALHADAFWTVVHDGALLRKGMPRFEQMTKEEARDLQAYIRAGAREALGTADAIKMTESADGYSAH